MSDNYSYSVNYYVFLIFLFLCYVIFLYKFSLILKNVHIDEVLFFEYCGIGFQVITLLICNIVRGAFNKIWNIPTLRNLTVMSVIHITEYKWVIFLSLVTITGVFHNCSNSPSVFYRIAAVRLAIARMINWLAMHIAHDFLIRMASTLSPEN